MPTSFSAPDEEQLTELARKWAAVERLVQAEYGVALTLDVSTLDVIQRLLDDDVIDRGAYALQCLGCVLGRVMARNIPGLDWAAIEDETESSICLRYADTTLCIHPLTMISKRLERGEAVNMRGLYEHTASKIEELANDVD